MRELGPPSAVLPPNYDVNAHCEFHYGVPRHFIENCKALKYKVQDLVDSKTVMFAPIDPNVNNNLMPPQDKTNINMV